MKTAKYFMTEKLRTVVFAAGLISFSVMIHRWLNMAGPILGSDKFDAQLQRAAEAAQEAGAECGRDCYRIVITREDDRKYAADETGTPVSEEYAELTVLEGGAMGAYSTGSGFYGYLDMKSGKPLSEARWQSVTGFENNYAVVRKNSGKTYINESFREVTERCFQDAYLPNAEGLTVVQDQNGYWGIYDLAGNTYLVEPFLGDLEHCVPERSSACYPLMSAKLCDGESVIIDITTSEVLLTAEKGFFVRTTWGHELFYAYSEEQDRLIDADGHPVISADALTIRHYSGTWYAFKKDQRWGLIDLETRVIIDPVYRSISGFLYDNDGEEVYVIAVTEDHRLTAVDCATGSIAQELASDVGFVSMRGCGSCYPFQRESTGLWGYIKICTVGDHETGRINGAGSAVVQVPAYRSAGEFTPDMLAVVRTAAGTCQVINDEFQAVTDPDEHYIEMELLKGGYIFARRTDTKGEILYCDSLNDRPGRDEAGISAEVVVNDMDPGISADFLKRSCAYGYAVIRRKRDDPYCYIYHGKDLVSRVRAGQTGRFFWLGIREEDEREEQKSG